MVPRTGDLLATRLNESDARAAFCDECVLGQIQVAAFCKPCIYIAVRLLLSDDQLYCRGEGACQQNA